MPPEDFISAHAAALGKNEAKHNLILGILERLAVGMSPSPRTWTLGGPGACAVQMEGRPIVLGDLDRSQCEALALAVRDADYPGVIGADSSPSWFVKRATELGRLFNTPVPQRIYSLSEPPHYPQSPGSLRQASLDDATLLLSWMGAFSSETKTEGPAILLNTAALRAGDYCLWMENDRPVAMAYINRRSRNTATISGVYTPPEFRRRGFGGSVTAGVAARIFQEGKIAACLYTDLRNPYSNRCYAKIGFRPVCDSAFYSRQMPT
jgi:RimJ/RimL family protein N-acetyltransferase